MALCPKAGIPLGATGGIRLLGRAGVLVRTGAAVLSWIVKLFLTSPHGSPMSRFFAQPNMLLVLLAVPLLVWWWLRRRPAGLRFSAARLLAPLPAGRSRRARWGGAGLRAAALGLGAIALAGPRWPDLHTRIPTEGIAIQMLVDVSGSMAEPDYHWLGEPLSRLEAVKRAFHLFIEGGESADGQVFPGRHDDLVGMVAFSTLPDSTCPLTLSHSVVLEFLDEQQPRTLLNESQTNIGDAIAWGLHRMESGGSRRKVMILLSDGEHNVAPPALTPRQAAQLAANGHVVIYCIDAGGQPDAKPASTGNEQASADAAERRAEGIKTLQSVAAITGGHYFKGAIAEGLLAVCGQIDRFERKEIRSFQYRRYYEMYPWLGVAAFGLLIGVYGLEQTFWQRLP